MEIPCPAGKRTRARIKVSWAGGSRPETTVAVVGDNSPARAIERAAMVGDNSPARAIERAALAGDNSPAQAIERAAMVWGRTVAGVAGTAWAIVAFRQAAEAGPGAAGPLAVQVG